MESIEDLLKELNDRLRRNANIQHIKECIEIDNRYNIQSSPACQAYKDLIHRSYICNCAHKSVWDVIQSARPNDIILDTGGAFHGTFKYIIFDDPIKYQRYIEAYMYDRDHRFSASAALYKDQYLVIPPTRKQKLMFDTAELSEQQFKVLMKAIVDYFNIRYSDILVIGKTSVGGYEIVIFAGENMLYENLDDAMCFINFLKEFHKEVAQLISPKEIHYGTSHERNKYTKVLQTQNMYDGQLQLGPWKMII